MASDAKQPIKAVDDRSYLYPHALPPLPETQGPPSESALLALQQRIPLDVDSKPGAAALAPDDGQAVARAVIGDALRIPLAWCQFGSCISWFTDTAALGERDVRSRAVAAGWRQDALGRLACPECVQRDPTFMANFPLVKADAVSLGVDPRAAGLRDLAEILPGAAEVLQWDRGQRRRLNLAVTAEPEPGRLAWWRRRQVGRHRYS